MKARLCVLLLALLGMSTAAAQAAAPPPTANGHAIVKGDARGKKSSSPNLIYHGGPVMTAGAAVTAIFWGTSWSASDSKISWLGRFYGGVGGSSYLGTNTEYTDSSGHVSSSVAYSGALIDNSAAITHPPQTKDIQAEVAKLISNPVPNGYYPVYIDQPRGHTQYCAWHSYGDVNGVTVQFGFFFNLDGDPGCDPQSPVSTYSQGVAALANVSGHELSEMLTDPQLNAWYDASGAENSDKCAWTFGSRTLSFGGASWKIQGNWSNAAYDANRGYTDADAGFVRGCIDGTN